ncbi:ATP-binding protein [Aurantiacibacter suaedae]|uniref:ATP-binding protein n=1 Tax=Aurantiacibacter suaedae TaxID=2545755 RepID=UPI0010F655F1|nr:HAMP domain-containing sensor histidine kinase [Aurantiacibacter suaedae]
MQNHDRAELCTRLHSTSPHERLSAVRDLSRDLNAEDIDLLNAALAVETTAFVKTALKSAIAKLEHPQIAKSDPADEKEDHHHRNLAEWRAMREVTGSLLHEILPRLGSIEYEAGRSVDNYAESKLAAKIESLKELMTAMQQLQEVSHPRKPTDFPIYRILKECVSEEGAGDLIKYDGDTKLVVLGDPNFLKLAFCNGLRNAVEASSNARASPIVVTWGESEVQYFIRIIDSGPGLKGAAKAAMTLGRTTKQGHMGFGLSIARTAMASMDGEISLEANNPSGVIFSMKWYRP